MEEIFEQPAERYIQTAFADEIEAVFSLAPQNPALRFLIGLCVIILAIFAIKYLARMMQWATEKFLKNRGFIAQSWLSMIIKSRLIGNIFFAIGMVFLASLSHVVISEFYPKIGILIVRVLNALVLIAVMMVVNSALSVIAGKFANALHLPVKGLVQAVKMLFWIITAILIIATLIDKDPGLLLGGLTALSAIAMLVFK
ncbi:MAG: hypothetical protein LBR90_00420, partial [Elusimicrobiota bacterium]|nr:hypothetical protein [Elusimicrobiota bacterium]